ncbi:Arabinogalactan peptide, AGP [Corchorus olitorius]|uniref:Arabinogalactan peptide, AGP n=1 Tax=Corchorus olitorius TaxID=93759 RepID=A0A1R3GIZ3_9ROSI|nr:Arabinogalactan peptide, AGP [Corchorus olitorius]
MSSMKLHVLPVLGFIVFALLQLSDGQSLGSSPFSSPAPAPSMTNDGAAIDQGIAYVLLLVALAWEKLQKFCVFFPHLGIVNLTG